MADKGKAVNYLRLNVYGKAEKKTITIKNGENAGNEKELLRFRAFHSEKLNDGSNEFSSTWYDVNCFQENTLHFADCIQEGLVLYVSGTVKTNNYTAKDGTERENLTLMANKMFLDLTQKGLKSFEFERQPKAKDKE